MLFKTHQTESKHCKKDLYPKALAVHVGSCCWDLAVHMTLMDKSSVKCKMSRISSNVLKHLQQYKAQSYVLPTELKC